jgi:adenylosuccinate lyase
VSLKDIILQQGDIMSYLSPNEVYQIMNPHTYLGSSVQIVEKVLEESREWF